METKRLKQSLYFKRRGKVAGCFLVLYTERVMLQFSYVCYQQSTEALFLEGLCVNFPAQMIIKGMAIVIPLITILVGAGTAFQKGEISNNLGFSPGDRQ